MERFFVRSRPAFTVGCVTAALLLSACTAAAPSAPPVPTTSPTTSAQATALARDLLADIVLPSAAQSQPSPPATTLRTPSSTVNCPRVATAHGFWTLRGFSVDSIQSYLEHHVPPRLRLSGTGDGTGPDTRSFTEVTFEVPAATTIFATLDVTAVPTAAGVAVRADATAIPATKLCAHA